MIIRIIQCSANYLWDLKEAEDKLSEKAKREKERERIAFVCWIGSFSAIKLNLDGNESGHFELNWSWLKLVKNTHRNRQRFGSKRVKVDLLLFVCTKRVFKSTLKMEFLIAFEEKMWLKMNFKNTAHRGVRSQKWTKQSTSKTSLFSFCFDIQAFFQMSWKWSTTPWCSQINQINFD